MGKLVEVPMEDKPGATQSAVCLDKIAQIAVSVSDLARSRSFYRDVLGMKFLFDAGNMCFFQCGEIRLAIGAAQQPFQPGATILYFKVDGIDSTHHALKEQGVAFVQPPHLVARMPDHELWMAFLKDPDGNTLALMSEIRPA
jgi:methylmalonyl-CoA/ethylmalonyl-CoA epimerase